MVTKNLPLTSQLLTLIITNQKLARGGTRHSLLILCKRRLTRSCSCHFRRPPPQKTAECSHFSFQGANAPQRASYHYIQIRRVEAVGSLPALNLLAKSVFCALFVCACIWFIPSARVFVKSFRCLCFTESMFVFGISAVLIAGDANSDAFKASRLFFLLPPPPPP